MSVKNIVCSALMMSALSSSLAGFESAEHMACGNSVKLQFPNSKSPSSLQLSNGLDLSYGEIVALAGDYFAILEYPISQGKTVDDQKERFLNAFKTLAESHLAPNTALRLVATFKNTLEAIRNGEKEGKSASEVYEELGGSLMKECNVITGGGSFITPLFPLGTAALQLLSDANWDHFVPHALTAYQAGHLVAMDEASKAGKIKDAKKRSKALEKAYGMNAFACHYLSDSFSAGHMRTPRKELSEHVDFAFVAALLMDFMHGEDSKEGLKVKNLNGDEWTAFGDSYYFDPENAYSKSVLEKILQISADEIYFAFQSGKDLSGGMMSEKINNLLPQFSALDDPMSRLNTAPLFYWDKKEAVLKRREDINGLDSYAWKSQWWGWTTLIDLGEYYRPLSSRQKALHEALHRHGGS
jgi:hypothetical protein